MTPLTFKDADGILLVCDLTDKSSLMGLKDWVKTIKDHAAEDIGIGLNNTALCMAGNKLDLEDLIQVSEDEMHQFSEYIGCGYIMTSAWHNKGIEVIVSLERMLSDR